MIIYSMTATFGKLEHETLTFQPGLNVIERPNEWGKSTWCAFLINMLYGIDNSERVSQKNGLPDKERYRPWSGAAMSGRIDLNWNGRNITIERRTTPRAQLGDFQAYETDTGLAVTELTGANCGQMLLGVERSVFTRSGFLRLADLPVTQDEALRRRLNNLVTTGDESDAGDKLATKLKELKNKIYVNRSTGLLPQVEAEQNDLEEQLRDLQELQREILRLRELYAQKEGFLAGLQNHKAALQYAASRDSADKVAKAEAALAETQAEYQRLVQLCATLPELSTATESLETAKRLQAEQYALQEENRQAPAIPEPPMVTPCFREIPPQEAIGRARQDRETYLALQSSQTSFNSKLWIWYVIAAAVSIGLALGGVFWQPVLYIVSGIVLLAAIAFLLIFANKKNQNIHVKLSAITDRYPGLSMDQWIAEAEKYLLEQEAYQNLLAIVTAQRQDLDQRLQALEAQIATFTNGDTLQMCIDHWNDVVQHRNALSQAQRDFQQAEQLVNTLRSMLKPVPKPKQEDFLTYSEGETDDLLASTAKELNDLQMKLGQYDGRAAALGQESVLRERLKAVKHRRAQLQETYDAVTLALTKLDQATSELQRRFAPRISKRAQGLFGKLTGDRYDRLTLGLDMSIQAGTSEEGSLRAASNRSDGTIDQLYLALRLAVAEELTPDAPLILDDAFVRFDDTRLAVAMDILREYAQTKQVILFTCQSRESRV